MPSTGPRRIGQCSTQQCTTQASQIQHHPQGETSGQANTYRVVEMLRESVKAIDYKIIKSRTVVMLFLGKQLEFQDQLTLQGSRCSQSTRVT
eukprot:1160173-Pelagomonas_calceolata.AAC.2